MPRSVMSTQKRTRGDAVEDDEATDLVGRRSEGTDVVVGQQESGRSFDVCREDDVGAAALDGFHHLVDRRRCPRGVPLVGHRPGTAYLGLGRNGADVEDL